MAPYAGDERRGYHDVAARGRDTGGPPLGLLLGVAAVVGIGFLTWYYLGPDFVRYMKIRDM
jgi:hypothetical protein